ncbi:hypothetical protein EJB05_29324 [Eragrostis curvula]|uniref:Autophagy-related protein 13 N-terminal domain-containing protein n=1 Tax=Eragrostis curvula TaxID=38414 RepID=A0A5J9UTP5_9POAL|nr:hypothetical protein EJB05_29324 [Eragrostis curvula]
MATPGASEPAMVEQVITEFFAKSLHIILESRSPYDSSRNFTRPSPPSSPLSGSQPRDRWFNLALRDCPAALENFDLWRQSNLEPLVIDIVLLQRDNTRTSSAGGDRIIERWVIKYETTKSGSGSGNGSKNSGRRSRSSSGENHSLYRRTYNGSMVLLRSLYLMVRLLPAHNLFQELNSSGRIRPLSLSHKISSFVEPFTREEDAEMKHYSFSPIETLFGHLSLSVSYVPVLELAAPESPTPLSTELIMDYVGSPKTEFLRKLNSLPSGVIAPPCVPVTRRHSWSTEHGTGPSVSSSPHPINSEPHGHVQPRMLMPDNSQTACSQPHNTSSGKKKISISEECNPSPPLSPSPSHSPSPSSPRNPFLRYESAPVVIPTVRAGGGGSGLPPSPGRKSKPQCSSQNENLTSSPNDKSMAMKDLVRLGEFHNDRSLRKVLSFGKDDLGYFHGLKLTRTSSKLFIMDELDERELVFAWEDKDTIIDQLNRIDISDREDRELNQDVGGSLTRSPDAAIGVLLRMLKNAPGLRERLLMIPAPPVPQEPSSLQRVVTEEPGSSASSSAVVPSSLLRSRTAADALEELNKYKEIRESILNRGKGQSRDTSGDKP